MDHPSQLVKRRTGSGWETEPLPAARSLVRARRQGSGRLAHRVSVFSVVVLTTVALVGLAASALTYRAGRAWRDRAASEITRTDDLALRLRNAQAQAAGSTAELLAVQEELTAAAAKLQRSEADVAQLENRVRELGTEKARVEDEREALRHQRASLAVATQMATQVGDELSGCVDSLTRWLSQRPSAVQPAPGDGWSDWARTGDLLVQACANAKGTNDRLLATLNG